jgi:hypothetical protein
MKKAPTFTRAPKIIAALLLALSLTACKFEVPQMDEKFGKQNFVSAVSMIELHKTRYGTYPDSIKDLKYLGDWDGIWLSAVRYEKVEGGYNLYVERGWVGKPALEMPAGFKEGLGIRDSNVKWLAGQESK